MYISSVGTLVHVASPANTSCNSENKPISPYPDYDDNMHLRAADQIEYMASSCMLTTAVLEYFSS